MAVIGGTRYYYIRIFKRAVGNPAYVWSNTYEIDYEGSGQPTTAQALTIAQNFLNAEKPLHGTNVEFVKAVMGTWDEDNTPYNPLSFVTYEAPNGTIGTRTLSGDPLPRRIALHVKRQADAGRNGKAFYRGVLAEGDMASTSALDFTMVPGSKTALDAVLSTMYTTMRTALGTGSPGPANIALLRRQGVGDFTTVESRAIKSFEARGITTSSDNHAYYDRL